MARRGRIKPPFTIREYVESDASRVVELVRELQAFEAPMNRWAKPASEISTWYIDQVKIWCGKHEGVILVAEQGTDLLGYACLLGRCEEDGSAGDVAYVYAHVADLVVTATSRGLGIGKALLEACERIAREKGRGSLRIGVLTQNDTAKAIYERFGFKPNHMTLEKMLT
jgi:GNAT superfamily N-acetyltransferase